MCPILVWLRGCGKRVAVFVLLVEINAWCALRISAVTLSMVAHKNVALVRSWTLFQSSLVFPPMIIFFTSWPGLALQFCLPLLLPPQSCFSSSVCFLCWRRVIISGIMSLRPLFITKTEQIGSCLGRCYPRLLVVFYMRGAMVCEFLKHLHMLIGWSLGLIFESLSCICYYGFMDCSNCRGNNFYVIRVWFIIRSSML